MSSFFYPHTVLVYPRSQVADGTTKRAGNLDHALSSNNLSNPITVSCDVQRKTTSEAFQMFGLELSSPAVLYCSLSDRASFTPNCLVVKGTDVFNVAGEARVLDAGDVLDGCVIPLEGTQVTTI